MKEQEIQVLIEPSCRHAALYLRSLHGLRDAAQLRGLSLNLQSDVDAIVSKPGVHAAVVISASGDWTHRSAQRLSEQGIKPILVGVAADAFQEPYSGPTLNRGALLDRQVQYFKRAGRTRLASVGNRSDDINDRLRSQYFLQACAAHHVPADEGDVFSGDGGIQDCVDRFLQSAHRYDGAVCVNDLVAVALIARAAAMGIRVPQDLFVAGSGDYLVGRAIQPSLTTTTLDYAQMGRMAADIWRYLLMHPGADRMQITLPCALIVRQSTANFADTGERSMVTPAEHAPAEGGDPAFEALQALEQCLLASDATDILILGDVLRGLSVERIAQERYLSLGTVNYRLRKIYASTGAGGKQALQTLLKSYAMAPEKLIQPASI